MSSLSRVGFLSASSAFNCGPGTLTVRVIVSGGCSFTRFRKSSVVMAASLPRLDNVVLSGAGHDQNPKADVVSPRPPRTHSYMARRIKHYFVRSSQDEMLSSANLPTYVPDTWACRNFPLPMMVSSFSAGMELGRGSAHPFTGSSISNCGGVVLFQK